MSVSKESKKSNTSKTSKTFNDLNVSDIRENDETNEINFILSGPSMNNIVSNTIIRTTLTLVGAYAFGEENITITENSSIFNNDMLALRFSNTPLYSKDKSLFVTKNFAEKCVQLEKDRNEDLYKKIPEVERLRRETNMKEDLMNNIHLNIDARNDTNDIIYATTNKQYSTFYKMENEIPAIYPEELHLVALKPKQTLVATLGSNFNIPLLNPIYASTQKAHHRFIKEDSYRVIITSYDQMSARQIVIEACNILMLKFENIRSILFDLVSKNPNENRDNEGTFEILNDKHTIGGILCRRMQDHEKIKFAGYKVDHPDDNHFILRYVCEGMTINRIINSVIDSLIKDYTDIRDSF